MSTHAYKHGVVLIECYGCNNRHLIADHLNWFMEGKDIEEILRLKGRGDDIRKLSGKGSLEFTPEDVSTFQEGLRQHDAARAERSKKYGLQTEETRTSKPE